MRSRSARCWADVGADRGTSLGPASTARLSQVRALAGTFPAAVHGTGTAVRGSGSPSPERPGQDGRNETPQGGRPLLWHNRSLILTAAFVLTLSAGSVRPAFAASPAPAQSTASSAEERRLAEAVDAIRHADYRGDRAELTRRAHQLEASTTPELEKYREYWRGFAYWRRVINGFNETPLPDDLFADLELATAAFRTALRLDPAFEDAKSALAGCLMSEMSRVWASPSDLKTKVFAEGIAALKALKESAQENPRSLWIL